MKHPLTDLFFTLASLDLRPHGDTLDVNRHPNAREAVSDEIKQQRIEAAKQKRLRKQRQRGGNPCAD